MEGNVSFDFRKWRVDVVGWVHEDRADAPPRCRPKRVRLMEYFDKAGPYPVQLEILRAGLCHSFNLVHGYDAAPSQIRGSPLELLGDEDRPDSTTSSHV